MDGTRRGRRPPPEVRREFTRSRLEAQVLARTYELIVPVIRGPVSTVRTLWDLIDEQAAEAPSRRVGQGA